MNNELPIDLLRSVALELSNSPNTGLKPLGEKSFGGVDELTRNLAGMPAETESEVSRLKSALSFLSADAERGNGRIFDSAGNPLKASWLGVVWAIRWLGWDRGQSIARDWSQKITRTKYSEEGFRKAWDSFDANHPSPVTIRSLYKLAALQGWQDDDIPISRNETVGAESQPKYRLLSPSDIANIKPITWRLKGVFPECGIGAIYGPSGSGKSFLAFDLGASVALGDEWFGLKTTATSVVYILLEGEAGLKHRAEAWQAGRGKPLPSNYHFIVQPVHLMTNADVEALIAVLPHQAVILLDTLNRAAPTADENSSKDMGTILKSASQIANATEGFVILVHHTGKDNTRGMRGHSSLFAAMDGAIEVARDQAGRSWSVAKTKDGADGRCVKFRLAVHQLGKDTDGEDITSCTVEPDQSSLLLSVAPRAPSGRKQVAAFKQLKAALLKSTTKGKSNAGSNTGCLKVDDAITMVANTMTTDAPNKRKNRAKSVLDSLIAGGFLTSGLEADEGWIWMS